MLQGGSFDQGFYPGSLLTLNFRSLPFNAGLPTPSTIHGKYDSLAENGAHAEAVEKHAATAAHIKQRVRPAKEQAAAAKGAAVDSTSVQLPSKQLGAAAAAAAATATAGEMRSDAEPATDPEDTASREGLKPADAGEVSDTDSAVGEFECKRMLWMAGLQVGYVRGAACDGPAPVCTRWQLPRGAPRQPVHSHDCCTHATMCPSAGQGC